MEIIKEYAATHKECGYTIKPFEQIRSCAPYVQYFGLVRDSARDIAWERFGTPSVPTYFASGLQKFHRTFGEFSDLAKPVSEDTEKELVFMLESLIQARQLITEIQKEKKS